MKWFRFKFFLHEIQTTLVGIKYRRGLIAHFQNKVKRGGCRMILIHKISNKNAAAPPAMEM